MASCSRLLTSSAVARQPTVTRAPSTDLVLKVRVSTMGQQQGTELSAALLCCLMEGSETPPVCGIHCCLESDEKGSDVQVSTQWQGLRERSHTDLILSIDISTILQEVFGHLQIVVASCQVQRGGVAAL
ncbi:hypothetical protein E2C01_010538 [Portunus trituberculatus]|uniref:Uncharacterized protein n=1 Tax=Portunus trituberculatus TaxID=210409 RepID=A0A5B7D8R4_PORTR|nr:hypothetical protein [Portunus trituberculatus]